MLSCDLLTLISCVLLVLQGLVVDGFSAGLVAPLVRRLGLLLLLSVHLELCDALREQFEIVSFLRLVPHARALLAAVDDVHVVRLHLVGVEPPDFTCAWVVRCVLLRHLDLYQPHVHSLGLGLVQTLVVCHSFAVECA